MGNEFVSDSLPKEDDGGGRAAPAPVFTYTEQFYKVFAFYLSIGMSADEFWNQDCTLAKYYRQANDLRQSRKNEELWLQGLYVYKALCYSSPIFNPFAKPGTEPMPYPKEPLPRTVKEAEEREERDRKLRIEKQREKMFAMASENSE